MSSCSGSVLMGKSHGVKHHYGMVSGLKGLTSRSIANLWLTSLWVNGSYPNCGGSRHLGNNYMRSTYGVEFDCIVGTLEPLMATSEVAHI